MGIFIKEIKEGSLLLKDVKVGDKIVKVKCILVLDYMFYFNCFVV